MCCEFSTHISEFCSCNIILFNVMGFLYLYFSRKTMTVPSLWEQYIHTFFSSVSCIEVHISPVQYVTHMKQSSWIRWWSIYNVSWSGSITNKFINFIIFPFFLPFFFVFMVIIFRNFFICQNIPPNRMNNKNN